MFLFICRWFCEGKELENSPDIQIITDGEHHSLIIAEAFEEDTGRYSCFASNFYGTDSTSAEIYVEGRFYCTEVFTGLCSVSLVMACHCLRHRSGASSSDSDVDHRPEHVAE